MELWFCKDCSWAGDDPNRDENGEDCCPDCGGLVELEDVCPKCGEIAPLPWHDC